MSDENKMNEFGDSSNQEEINVFDLGKSDDMIKLDIDDSDNMEQYLSNAVAEVAGDMNNNKRGKKYSPYRWSHLKKLLVGLGTTVSCLAFIVVFFVGMLLYNIRFDGSAILVPSNRDGTEAQQTVPPLSEEQMLKDKGIVNILLIGREGIWDGENANGRSDSMIIASMDTNKKTVKMVSIMRDCYVDIYGYKPNKLNAAYSYGGGPLLMDTIQRNFGITLAGYVVVDFKAFVKIIDAVGGVDIELTPREATYLNTTNYIAKKKYRNVVTGVQRVNGVQALGYCRVRKVAACNGENDDYGRTFRQRAVLTQVYKKAMGLSIPKAMSLANELCGYVSTNISTKDLLDYVGIVLNMGISPDQLSQMRIPESYEDYTGQNLSCGSCLVLNFDSCKRKLWMYLYGTETRDAITYNPNVGSSTIVSNATPVPSAKATTKPVQTTKVPVVTVIPTERPIVETPEPVVTNTPDVPEATSVPATKEPEKSTPEPVTTKEPKEPKEPEPEPDDGSVG
jgi:LCP family protein required for cell wall assembly